MKLKRFNNMNEATGQGDGFGDGYIFIARYPKEYSTPLRVEELESDLDDDDLQDMCDEVEQQFGRSIILDRAEAEDLMDKLQMIIRHKAKP